MSDSDSEIEWGNIADYANSVIVRDENEVDEDEDLDESSSEDNPEEESVPENKDVYNRVALLQKLEEIVLPKSLPWDATLALNSGFTHEGISSEDDFNREVSFYKQAVAGCILARTRFEEEGFKYKRPTDYFAEMVKADSHMAKVRQNLLDQQKRLEAVEERRRQRELKKFGKKVQVEKEQARAHQKKQEIEAVKKWRKEQKNKTPETREDITVLLEDEERLHGKGSDKSKKRDGQDQKRPNLKRQRKDEKYGFGGPKKKAKRNEADSTDDLTGFSVRKNKTVAKEFLPLTRGFGASKGPKGGHNRRGSGGPSNVKRVRK